MIPETPAPSWVQFLPLLTFSLIYVALIWWLAPRKGISPWYALIGLIPCFGTLAVFFIFIYLLTLTDKAVLDEIADLRRRLADLETSKKEAGDDS
jgi:hypothetical protein